MVEDRVEGGSGFLYPIDSNRENGVLIQQVFLEPGGTEGHRQAVRDKA